MRVCVGISAHAIYLIAWTGGSSCRCGDSHKWLAKFAVFDFLPVLPTILFLGRSVTVQSSLRLDDDNENYRLALSCH